MRVEHAEEKRVTEHAEADGKKPDRGGKETRLGCWHSGRCDRVETGEERGMHFCIGFLE